MNDASGGNQPQTSTLIVSALVSAVLGIAGGAGLQHFSLPELESRIDELEAAKLLMEYQISELREFGKKRCQGDRTSALAKEKIKVKRLDN